MLTAVAPFHFILTKYEAQFKANCMCLATNTSILKKIRVIYILLGEEIFILNVSAFSFIVYQGGGGGGQTGGRGAVSTSNTSGCDEAVI